MFVCVTYKITLTLLRLYDAKKQFDEDIIKTAWRITIHLFTSAPIQCQYIKSHTPKNMSNSQLFMSISQIGGIVAWDYKTHLVELFLVCLSIAVHILDAHQHIWARILVFPNLLLNLFVYTKKQLYGKVLYSLVTVFLNLYAYLKWKGGQNSPPARVHKTSPAVLVCTLLLGLLGAGIWCFLMQRYARIPLTAICFDAIYTSFGFVEKWFMSHKKLERWILALLRYLAFSIACYKTGSVILAVHHIILIFVALYGQAKWYKAYKAHKT